MACYVAMSQLNAHSDLPALQAREDEWLCHNHPQLGYAPLHCHGSTAAALSRSSGPGHLQQGQPGGGSRPGQLASGPQW